LGGVVAREKKETREATVSTPVALSPRSMLTSVARISSIRVAGIRSRLRSRTRTDRPSTCTVASPRTTHSLASPRSRGAVAARKAAAELTRSLDVVESRVGADAAIGSVGKLSLPISAPASAPSAYETQTGNTGVKRKTWAGL
jgi:hypothetical protein